LRGVKRRSNPRKDEIATLPLVARNDNVIAFNAFVLYTVWEYLTEEDAMELPVYVSVDEVKRVCRELKIRDWTALTEAKVLPEEAQKILSEVNAEKMNIDPEDFRQGLEVELEHGTRFKDSNVTNNHPLLTGKIVIAHMKESLDYYKYLEVAEIEGDMLKAVVTKNPAKIEALYRKLIKARRVLSTAEAGQIK
jgi:hypothetical protein